MIEKFTRPTPFTNWLFHKFLWQEDERALFNALWSDQSIFEWQRTVLAPLKYVKGGLGKKPRKSGAIHVKPFNWSRSRLIGSTSSPIIEWTDE